VSAIFRAPRVVVVGVLNATPDSFADAERFVRSPARVDLARGIDRAAALVREGADVLDVGGESTRPGAAEVPAALECERVVPLVEALVKRFAAPVSIDTRKAAVAEAALDSGARVVNDVSGLRHDPGLAAVVARASAELVVGHMRGTPETMQRAPHYDDVIAEVAAELRASLAAARAAGVPDRALVIDPGIGFGKRPEDNHALLVRIGALRAAVGGDLPVLVGPSRKSFLRLLGGGEAPEERDAATHAAVAVAVYEGADAVRVHDVAGAVRACAVARALRAARQVSRSSQGREAAAQRGEAERSVGPRESGKASEDHETGGGA
jgi:dihydropteroate synthase